MLDLCEHSLGSRCTSKLDHNRQVLLRLRADGATMPESVAKWADEANWMGGDAVVLTADTAEVRRGPSMGHSVVAL